jgi:hypothetical protein
MPMGDETTILCDEDADRCEELAHPPMPIADVLVELLAQYQARFPEMRLTVIESSSAA